MTGISWYYTFFYFILESKSKKFSFNDIINKLPDILNNNTQNIQSLTNLTYSILNGINQQTIVANNQSNNNNNKYNLLLLNWIF